MNTRIFLFVSLLLPALSAANAQAVVQRGPLGQPVQVFDETQQWTTPLQVATDKEVEIYIPDVSSTAWLQENYPAFLEKGQYMITMFTLYKSPEACQKNQIGWGNGDGKSLNECNEIGYRIRQANVDWRQKTVSLIMAAMLDDDGGVIPSTTRRDSITRTWAELDKNTQTALQKTTDLAAEQMKRYDRKQQGIR